ncbi:hypothetical protein FOL47_010275 [Perkinsus chesapeaki]|uniref:START domain-containing protein n=1 Tax=Perkinsus chesapeaki TaxID=330153 RepID=A0A7J6L3Z3_PERCH|nr:hypothetical protein FOL47_010275 [Perkinsus chesapeaki]
MSHLSIGYLYSCCTATSSEPKTGEITVECEDDPSTGEGSCSSSRRRPSLLASLWPIAEEEEPLTGVFPGRVRVSSGPPLKKLAGDVVVFEDCCFSDSVSRLSSFTSEDAAFFSQLQEPVGIEDLGVEMPFGHLPPVDAEELAEFDIALASEVFESIQVLCEEYERFFQARRRLEWLDAYLQRHMDREHAAMDFRASVAEDLCIVRLRQKLEWLDIALEISKTDDTSQVCTNGECVWLHEQLSADKNLWLRQNKDGTMTLKIDAVLPNPTYHIISLVREVDLHANWIPFLAGSRRDHIIQGCGRRCQQMVTHEYSVPIPFVPSRSVSLYAFACDALDEPDLESIIIYGRSIPDDATDFWGYPVPKLKGSKMDLKTLSFVMKPLERGNATSFTMIANVDPKVYLPEKILAWLCKQYAKYIFHSIEKLSQNFENTEYPKLIAENREFYGFVEDSVLRRIRAMDNRHEAAT